MRYALLICTEESAEAAMSPEEGAVMMEGYMAFGEEMGGRGVLTGGERLRPTTDATTVRVRNGEVLTTDGPFAETKEQMGGFYLIDCKDLDEAIEIAAKIPGAAEGSVEVRPIWEM
ncbi:MAG TPA: YciI family protein [Acidimicrobiales bacterium]|nr:YciI family protein [Acidimicrobiales bacterium]